MKIKKIIAGLIVILIIASGAYFLFHRNKTVSNKKEKITISAASSLYEPLNKIIELYESNNQNVKVDVNYASSSTLESQIENGAPVDVFISATPKYTNELINKNIISKNNVSNFLGNKLILASSGENNENIKSIEELKNTTGKIALGDKAVPVGLYGSEALKNLGILNSISDRIVYCKDAMSILNYLEKGEVNYGVIYENELVGAKNVKKVADFPSNSYSKIVYTIANLNDKEDTTKLKEFLQGNQAKDIFKSYGFEVNLK